MSARVHGEVTIQLVEKRSEIHQLDVSWTSKADQRKQVAKVVGNWARGRRGWWGVFIDTTAIHAGAAGKVFINENHSTHVAVFTVLAKGAEAVPPPLSVMSIVSRRR